MKPQTGRIVRSSSPSWLFALMPLMIDAVCGRAQYASPYGNAYAISTSNYAPSNYANPDVQSLWSGPPIIVNDNQFGAQEQQQYPKSNVYYGGAPSTYRQPYPNWRSEQPTRAPNHNYNNVPGYFYYQQQETTPSTPLRYPQSIPPQLQPYPQRNPELDTSDSRREEEEQVVRIGGSRSLATNNYQNTYNNNENFYEPAQPWRRRDIQAKYAQHFAEYLRKYPRRLQPVYSTSEDFDEK
ncbi:uncharacterized protein LOC122616843 [Drosophila teissieri]|uniref:uncharacterized protein LOC122616843 n=1 Tax=Drosophila teissieri TaxID=7243 RepID=UPI001CB9E50C|nr:uncharacterized protein LOC122616843 [Drosophila teissieri]